MPYKAGKGSTRRGRREQFERKCVLACRLRSDTNFFSALDHVLRKEEEQLPSTAPVLQTTEATIVFHDKVLAASHVKLRRLNLYLL